VQKNGDDRMENDEREAVEKGTSRNRRCDVSDTSSIPSPLDFFAGLIAVETRLFRH